MSTEAKVTREHRISALEFLNEISPRDGLWSPRIFEGRDKWLTNGGSHYVGCNEFGEGGKDAELTAEAIAHTEHAIRAAVIADLRGLVEQSFHLDIDAEDPPDYVYADSIRNLIETLEAQNG